LVFYLLAYACMTSGAFAVVTALSENEAARENYSDFAGLGFRRPFLALAMTLFMLSLAGFPPLGGFTAKFYIFRSAVLSGHTLLAIIGVLNSLLSVVYYLRVMVAMYMEEGGAEGRSFAQSPYLYVAVCLAVAGTLYLGILPARVLEWSRVAFLSLD
jgi:NADH-quinone oxidoreductase subunit N